MLLKIKWCLWKVSEKVAESGQLEICSHRASASPLYVLFTRFSCVIVVLCSCRITFFRAWAQCWHKVSPIVCRDLFLLSSYNSSNYTWAACCEKGTVCSSASQSFPTIASNENRQFGLAETWLAFSCDRLSGCLVLRDGDVVVFHGAARDALWGFCLLWNKSRTLLSSCSHCPSIHPSEGKVLKVEKKSERQNENHTQRSHMSKYRADLSHCLFTFLYLFHKFHLEYEPSVNQQSTETARAD